MIDMPEFAYAATPTGGGGGLSLFLLLGGMFVIMYFLMIRPQSKRRKEHQALVSSLSKGDEVVTIGGITGHVTKVEEGFVKIKVANNVELRMQKTSVNASLPKGTLKSLEES